MIYALIFLIVMLSAVVVAMIYVYQKQRKSNDLTIQKLQQTIAILEAINKQRKANLQLSDEIKSVLDKARASIDQQLLDVISEQLGK